MKNEKEQLENVYELYRKFDDKYDEAEFLLNSIPEGNAINKDVTEEFETAEEFIGTSKIETTIGQIGYMMSTENPNEKIFAQFYSDNKTIHVYFKDGFINKTKYLVLDTEIDTSVKRLKKIKELVENMITIQNEIDFLEDNQEE